jgi:hypothetical protein
MTKRLFVRASVLGVLVAAFMALASLAWAANTNSFTVNSTGDAGDADTGDDVCDTG